MGNSRIKSPSTISKTVIELLIMVWHLRLPGRGEGGQSTGVSSSHGSQPDRETAVFIIFIVMICVTLIIIIIVIITIVINVIIMSWLRQSALFQHQPVKSFETVKLIKIYLKYLVETWECEIYGGEQRINVSR